MTRGGRKHRISATSIKYGLEHNDPASVQGDVTLYVGVDSRGVELEVATVPDHKVPGGQAVIHAMPTAYRRKPK